MSKEEKYNDRNDGDLPLPDQEQSWQKMQALLDAEDRNRRILPSGVLKSCAGWGLVAAGILAFWYFAEPENWFDSKATAATEYVQKIKEDLTTVEKIPGSTEQPEERTAPGRETDLVKSNPTTHPNPGTENVIVKDKVQTQLRTPGKNPGNGPIIIDEEPIYNPQVRIKKSRINTQEVKNKKVTYNTIPSKVTSEKERQDITKEAEPVTKENDPVRPVLQVRPDQISQPAAPASGNSSPAIPTVSSPLDTAIKKQLNEPALPKAEKDSNAVEDSSRSREPLMPTPLKKRKFFVTAGLGLQQQVRLNKRDSSMDYDRKTSLSDYVPSLYVRLHKEDKWFLQGEFRYGAPQSLRNFSFSRQTTYDSAVITTTTLTLRRTYYHQLPVSFNYYLRPKLSVGIGGIYSRFYRAVTEQEIKNRNLFTQAETVTKRIVEVPRFTDSFFYKTQVHLLLQADYEWRRFSFGLRYTRDIQPYIKYTQPDGLVNEMKNQTFQILIRYRFWKSARFNIHI